MPEGPTIIVFKKEIEKYSGKKVTESGGYRNPFSEDISGQKLTDIKTFGKYLILQFPQFFVTVHFGMYGSFLVNDVKKINPSFSLHFGSDFINFYVVNIKKIEGKSDDYFDEELDVFSKNYRLQKTKDLLLDKFLNKKIGDILMNQNVFPGLGNVIRNEVLYFAKIHPESLVKNIPSEKIDELLYHIEEFSRNSVVLIEQKIWKSSAAVYGKSSVENHPVKVYTSKIIKRKNFVAEEIQKLYL